MLTPSDIEQVRFMDTKELKKRLYCSAEKIGWLRQYGLLKYRKLGKRCLTTEAEFLEFINDTVGMDLSNREKIEMQGILLRNKKSASQDQREALK